jgi:hypothetical protein
MTNTASFRRNAALCLTLGFLAVASATTGCAATGATSAATSAAPAITVYNDQQVARIMSLRMEGDSLADVAKEVGGSRASVRAAEREELTRARNLRHTAGALSSR